MIKTIRYLMKEKLRELFSDLSPTLFLQAERLKNKNNSRGVAPDTHLVIEGFPRSGNSFACRAFWAAQDRQLKIAHHLHLPSNIIMGVRLGKPALVLIRKPRDAVISFVALNIQAARRINPAETFSSREVVWLLKGHTKYWIRFYTKVKRYREQVVFATFEEVTTDFGAVIQRLNDRYGISFSTFSHTKQNVENIFNSTGYHLSPSPERNEIKQMIEQSMSHEAVSRLLETAENSYRALLLELEPHLELA